MANFTVEAMTGDHWPQVSAIYAEGIRTGNSTFEKHPPAWEKWDQSHLGHCRLVARSREEILGWAALSPISAREVYRGVAEVSVYVAEKSRGLGVGKALLEALVKGSETAGIWTLQAGIFPENETSVRLHLKCGFREVGRRERLGKMDGVWRDVLLLERRSKVTGND